MEFNEWLEIEEGWMDNAIDKTMSTIKPIFNPVGMIGHLKKLLYDEPKLTFEIIKHAAVLFKNDIKGSIIAGANKYGIEAPTVDDFLVQIKDADEHKNIIPRMTDYFRKISLILQDVYKEHGMDF